MCHFDLQSTPTTDRLPSLSIGQMTANFSPPRNKFDSLRWNWSKRTVKRGGEEALPRFDKATLPARTTLISSPIKVLQYAERGFVGIRTVATTDSLELLASFVDPAEMQERIGVQDLGPCSQRLLRFTRDLK